MLGEREENIKLKLVYEKEGEFGLKQIVLF